MPSSKVPGFLPGLPTVSPLHWKAAVVGFSSSIPKLEKLRLQSSQLPRLAILEIRDAEGKPWLDVTASGCEMQQMVSPPLAGEGSAHILHLISLGPLTPEAAASLWDAHSMAKTTIKMKMP